MSEPENFLDRWSRRKRDAKAEFAAPETAQEKPPAVGESDAPKAAPAGPAGPYPPVEAAFDSASLPPIESIGATSDVRAFLQPGVPSELTRAALRRAWSADPEIRDFIGLVENGWDFNDPNGVPGFGPITAGEVARLLAQAIGVAQPELAQRENDAAAPGDAAQIATQPSAIEFPEQPAANAPAQKGSDATSNESLTQRSDDDGASQNKSDEKVSCPPSRRHTHGGALPK